MKMSFRQVNRSCDRSGTIYIMAMGASLIVACLAIAGLQTVRVQRRMNDQISQAANARKFAEAGIEFVQNRIKTDTKWRSFFVNGVSFTRAWTGGSFSVTLLDPVDGNIANRTTDPVVVTSTGRFGKSTQKLSARIDPQIQLYPACQSALYATDSIEFKGCTVTANQWAYCENTTKIRSNPTVNMNVLSKSFSGIITNITNITQRSITGGTWPMQTPDLDPSSSSYVGNYYHDNGVVIQASDIPTGGAEMIKNGNFLMNTASWTGLNCTLTADSKQKYNGVASCLVSGQSGVSYPLQNITEHIIKGREYNVSFWVRTIENQDISAVILLTLSGNPDPVVKTGRAVKAEGNEWTQVTAEIDATWSGVLSKAEFYINSEKNSNYHFDAVSIQDAERDAGTRYIEHVVLGSGSNPYGPGTVSANGIYSIYAPGEKIIIRNCRINGTIVVQSADEVRLENAISWEPTGRNFPALIANTSIEESTSVASLQEDTIGINANPASAPYRGVSDNDTSDSYPSLISGAMVSTNDILLRGVSELSGPVVSDSEIEVRSTDLKINFRSDMILNPPPGFFADPPPMRLTLSSLQSAP
ncbi:MAG: carbohydrate binding domain-containing protein [Pirellula sp.]